jgi:hypothetical protein
MGMRPIENDWGPDFEVEIPPKLTIPEEYIPDYRPVIKALKELAKAFEVIENRGDTHLQASEHKRRSDSAKKRWEPVPKERRRAITAPARAARTKRI